MRQQTYIRYNANFTYFLAVLGNFSYPYATFVGQVARSRPPVRPGRPNPPVAAGSMPVVRHQQPWARLWEGVRAAATHDTVIPSAAAERRARPTRVRSSR